MAANSMPTHGASPLSQKTRNPGYIPGDHWVYCDVCGLVYRESQTRLMWDGKVVCKQDWEPRHEQDFLRVREDRIAAQGNVRPEPSNSFVDPHCSTRSSVSGVAIAGCAIVGNDEDEAFTSSIPTGTFDNSL